MSIKKILISQPKPESGKSPYYDVAAKYEAEVTFRPFFRIETVTAREFRNQKINILEHTAIILNSRKAMENFFKLCEDLRITMSDTMKYFCLNEQVALYLQKFITYRKRKVFFPETGGKHKLSEIIIKHNKEHFLMPVSEDQSNDFANILSEKKVKITQAVMYRTVSNEFSKNDNISNYDIVVLFSPAGIKAIKDNYPNFEQEKIIFGAFGPKTTKAIEEEGWKLEIAAPSEECPSMVLALDKYLKENK